MLNGGNNTSISMSAHIGSPMVSNLVSSNGSIRQNHNITSLSGNLGGVGLRDGTSLGGGHSSREKSAISCNNSQFINQPTTLNNNYS